ncbi:MAG: hypothetical protein AABZ31_07340 [Bdellovibrionota bacterium]
MIKICFISVLALYFLGGCAGKTKGTPSPAAQSAASATSVPKKDDKAASVVKAEKKFGTVCLQGSDQRRIEVIRLPERGVSSEDKKVCEVIYTKFSKSESVASSVQSIDHCESISKKIQSNLEASGFSCKI